jgi:hypothetical protein
MLNPDFGVTERKSEIIPESFGDPMEQEIELDRDEDFDSSLNNRVSDFSYSLRESNAV